jgi:hypothetical protein
MNEQIEEWKKEEIPAIKNIEESNTFCIKELKILMQIARSPLIRQVILREGQRTTALKILKEADTAPKKLQAIKDVIKVLEEKLEEL